MKPTILVTFLTFASSITFSQTLSRSVISSFGGSSSQSGLYVSHTAGQEGRVDSKKEENLSLQQGFEKNIFSFAKKITLSNKIEFQLFPNPTRREFTVQTNLTEEDYLDVTIYSLAGKLLYTTQYPTYNSIQVTLPTSLASGTYLIRLSTPSGKLGNSRLIKY
ncbi:T9SS type A sorting domain-containing protein [Flavobacteriales bacterium]|nr:T9SS type A sorting domain-containing protein [Flavobacteriales bacterium]